MACAPLPPLSFRNLTSIFAHQIILFLFLLRLFEPHQSGAAKSAVSTARV
jgi:hypothetical protein